MLYFIAFVRTTQSESKLSYIIVFSSFFYPITPSPLILHQLCRLTRYRNSSVLTFHHDLRFWAFFCFLPAPREPSQYDLTWPTPLLSFPLSVLILPLIASTRWTQLICADFHQFMIEIGSRTDTLYLITCVAWSFSSRIGSFVSLIWIVKIGIGIGVGRWVYKISLLIALSCLKPGWFWVVPVWSRSILAQTE